MEYKLLDGQRWFLKLCLFFVVVCLLALSADFVLAVYGRIAFTSYRDGGERKIYIMDSHGEGRFELTEGHQPAWLPNGEKIGFHYRDDVWVINVNGTNRVNITKGINRHSEQWPTWSPIGRKIAYYGRLGPVWDIFVMDADGKNPKNLTRDPSYHGTPSWSPYGNRITFMSRTLINVQPFRTDTAIIVMDTNGGKIMNITNHPRNKNSAPSWSPDGKKIAYSASPKPGLWLPPTNIHLMNVDGTNPVVLTPQERWAYEWSPTWSPDSKRLAFRKQSPDGWTDIYTINADGSDLRNITQTHRVDEASPAWSPYPLSVSSSGRMAARWGEVKQSAKRH